MARRLIVTFRKVGGATYLSHLDLMATLEFSIRRARLPVSLAEGFNPRPRIALAAPLPLGHIGEAELLEINLAEDVGADEVARRLSETVPGGIEIVSVEEGRSDIKSTPSRVRRVVYRIALPDSVADLSSRISGLMAKETIEIQ